MKKEEIFEIVKNSIVEVLEDIDESLISTEVSLKQLGANSIDRVDILIMSMEKLNLKIKMMEFSEITNIGGIVDLLYTKLNA